MIYTENYFEQAKTWPKSGRHILAQFDAESVIVYQAYRPAIGLFAAEHGYFGGEFSYSRMSWIKPNFMWMMYRSGWGKKPSQEVILAVRIRRFFFDILLAQAVESFFDGSQYLTFDEWQKAIARSSVRMQWDPDHHPRGGPLERRALQLGLKGRTLKDYGKKEILEIIDISSFVAEQYSNVTDEKIKELVTPSERLYLPEDLALRDKLRLDKSKE